MKRDAYAKHRVKRCPFGKGGAARAPEMAAVCRIGGLALARPVGEEKKGRRIMKMGKSLLLFSFLPFLFSLVCYLSIICTNCSGVTAGMEPEEKS